MQEVMPLGWQLSPGYCRAFRVGTGRSPLRRFSPGEDGVDDLAALGAVEVAPSVALGRHDHQTVAVPVRVVTAVKFTVEVEFLHLWNFVYPVPDFHDEPA